MNMKVAIIGAGISGIAAARELTAVADVRVFEKSRGLGGRITTRRAEPFAFDHGAQFFTARSTAFQTLINGFPSSIVQPWSAKLVTLEPERKTFKREWYEEHFIGLPGMNGMLKAMASDLPLQLGTRVSQIQANAKQWRLRNEHQESLGDFDWVISAAPAPQTLALLPESFPELQRIATAQYSPCFALLLGLDQATELNFDAAIVRNEPIAWIAVNNKKPDRARGTSIVIHSDNSWAETNLEADQDEVIAALLASFKRVTGVDGTTAKYTSLHRWRYARVEQHLQSDFLLDSQLRLAACGDWCRGNRVEDAYLSGQSLGKSIADLVS